MQFLVLPRLLALILMMPLPALYADLMGILGGALVTVSAFDVSLLQYYNETRRAGPFARFHRRLAEEPGFGIWSVCNARPRGVCSTMMPISNVRPAILKNCWRSPPTPESSGF